MGLTFRAKFWALVEVLRISQWWQERKPMTLPGRETAVTSPSTAAALPAPCSFRLSCAMTVLLTFICRSLELFYAKVSPEEVLLCV